MTLTFESDYDVIIYALEKIISFARVTQYIFVANCVWWIAEVIGLDNGLIKYIDDIGAKERICKDRLVSPIPRDIARGVSPELPPSDYRPDPLGRSRKGRVNPLPETKRQLRHARRKQQLRKAKSEILGSAAVRT
jgi:hypothetical protein